MVPILTNLKVISPFVSADKGKAFQVKFYFFNLFSCHPQSPLFTKKLIYRLINFSDFPCLVRPREVGERNIRKCAGGGGGGGGDEKGKESERSLGFYLTVVYLFLFLIKYPLGAASSEESVTHLPPVLLLVVLAEPALLVCVFNIS